MGNRIDLSLILPFKLFYIRYDYQNVQIRKKRFFQMFYSLFQKRCHEKETNIVIAKAVRLQRFLYQHGEKIVFYFFMGLRLPKCN